MQKRDENKLLKILSRVELAIERVASPSSNSTGQLATSQPLNVSENAPFSKCKPLASHIFNTYGETTTAIQINQWIDNFQLANLVRIQLKNEI